MCMQDTYTQANKRSAETPAPSKTELEASREHVENACGP